MKPEENAFEKSFIYQILCRFSLLET